MIAEGYAYSSLTFVAFRELYSVVLMARCEECVVRVFDLYNKKSWQHYARQRYPAETLKDVACILLGRYFVNRGITRLIAKTVSAIR